MYGVFTEQRLRAHADEEYSGRVCAAVRSRLGWLALFLVGLWRAPRSSSTVLCCAGSIATQRERTGASTFAAAVRAHKIENTVMPRCSPAKHGARGSDAPAAPRGATGLELDSCPIMSCVRVMRGAPTAERRVLPLKTEQFIRYRLLHQDGPPLLAGAKDSFDGGASDAAALKPCPGG